MIRNRLPTLATAAFLAFSTLMGCVLREERITIARNGSVVYELEISGSEEELTQGDAMPSAESGWVVNRRIEQDDDEEKLVLTSTRKFAPGEALPRTFAAPHDPDDDLYLDFPTEVRVEQRRDGLYFFFHRVYTPRRWAHVQYWQAVFFDEDIEKLGAKPVEELTRDERRAIIQAFASVEAFKQLEFAKAALAESIPDLPVEHRLIARQALLSVYEKHRLLVHEYKLNIFDEGDDLDRLIERIERCDGLTENERGTCYDAEEARLLGEAYTAFVESLRDDAGMNEAQIDLFERAYERAERYYDITNDLGTDQFEVEVIMPGTLVAHNANEVDVDKSSETSVATWKFNGKAFRDRSHELIVVSRLETDRDGKQLRPADDSDR